MLPNVELPDFSALGSLMRLAAGAGGPREAGRDLFIYDQRGF